MIINLGELRAKGKLRHKDGCGCRKCSDEHNMTKDELLERWNNSTPADIGRGESDRDSADHRPDDLPDGAA